VHLYQWDENDPLLKAWMSAFPGTVEPKSALSADLLAHLRYPEDLFKVQREVLARYHVTQDEPLTFYGGSENWEVPADPEVSGDQQPPYYLTVKVPDSTPEFSLTSVYVPRNRSNLAAFVAVNADASSDNYGKFTILQLPSNATVSGPSQAANAMQTDTDVTQKLLPYKNAGTRVLFGNLLTLPVGDEMLYVEPVYTLREGSGTYPILQYIVVSLGSGGSTDEGNQVGISTSFDCALADALGLGTDTCTGGTTTPPPDNGGGQQPPPTGTQQQRLTQLLSEAATDLEQANAALRNGDLAEYQRLNEAAANAIAEAQRIQNQISGGSSSGGPTSGAPSSGTPSSGGG
jgi:uncharacterized protein